MELFYEGTDITGQVQIVSAIGRDVSDSRCDSLELVFDRAAAWYRWKPAADDRLELFCQGYSTGTMYISAVKAEQGRYRILATSEKTTGRRKANRTFDGKTLGDVMKLCAAESGMDYRIFGLPDQIYYPYLQRVGMGNGAFLGELAGLEGAVLKTYSGRYTMIGVREAQKLEAVETVSLSANQPGAYYQRREECKIRTLTVKTPYACVAAQDSGAKKGTELTIGGLPARDAATAGRWARGLLLGGNRKAEQLTIDTVFRQNWTAMRRIDVAGGTDADGQWLIDEVTHDFINGTSRATLLRCIDTID